MNKKSPQIVGLRRNTKGSKREMFTNRKPTHDFVLTLSAKFCSICHCLADIFMVIGRRSCAPYYISYDFLFKYWKIVGLSIVENFSWHSQYNKEHNFGGLLP